MRLAIVAALHACVLWSVSSQNLLSASDMSSSAEALDAGAGGAAAAGGAGAAADADHRPNPVLGLAQLLVAASASKKADDGAHMLVAGSAAEKAEAEARAAEDGVSSSFRKKGAHNNHPFFSYYGLLVSFAVGPSFISSATAASRSTARLHVCTALVVRRCRSTSRI